MCHSILYKKNIDKNRREYYNLLIEKEHIVTNKPRKTINIILGILIVPIILVIGLYLPIITDRLDAFMQKSHWMESKTERIAREEQEEDQSRFEEFSNRDISEFLLLVKNTFFYSTGKDWNDMLNSLFEVTIENNMPTLHEFDIVGGLKEIINSTLLPNYEFSPSQYYYRNSPTLEFYYKNNTDVTLSSIIFTEKDGVMNIWGTSWGAGLGHYPSNDIEPLLFRLSNERRETQIQYTGIFEFDHMEIIRDIRNDDEPFPEPFDRLFITFTGAGNLWLHNEDRTYRRFFYINDPSSLRFLNYPTQFNDQYYYFDGDYLVYYNSTIGPDGPSMEGPYFGVEYKMYYRKIANGT